MAGLFPPDPPAPSSEAERRATVALGLVPGVGSARIRALVDRLGSAEAVLRSAPRALTQVDGVGRQTADAIRAFDGWAAVDEAFERADRVGARLLLPADAAYPALLREIYDPPAALWVRGRLAAEDARGVAVVGTRRATDYGRRAAEAFGRGLAERGVTVVSGLAYGIDIAAHRAALDGGGRTVAVLGSGVDRIYPARHAPTVRQLLETDAGAVVSELLPGAAPDASHFPRRNRIVSGMTLGTVVVEAHERGGALLTAAMALEQNREVFAVPAPMFAETSGTNRLIRRGYAALAAHVDHVLDELGPALGAEAASPPPEAPLPADLTAVERQLLGALGTEPRGLDGVCADARVDASTALVYLLQLEFRGLVRQLAGKQFYRA